MDSDDHLLSDQWRMSPTATVVMTGGIGGATARNGVRTTGILEVVGSAGAGKIGLWSGRARGYTPAY